VPRGEHLQTFGTNVQGSIEIAIMTGATCSTRPAPIRKRECVVHGSAHITGLDRRVPAVDHRQVASGRDRKPRPGSWWTL